MADTPLASYLRMLRQQNHLNQDDVADALGIKRAGYSHYENARTVPTVENLRILADLYKIPLEKLVRLTGDDFEPEDIKRKKKDKGTNKNLYVGFLKECADMKPDELARWMTLEDKELIYYCHKLSERDRNILVVLAKMMLE